MLLRSYNSCLTNKRRYKISKYKKKGFIRRAEEPYKINEKIRAQFVRVVGDNADNEIHDIDSARKMAREQNLDLVEISPKADPPVCKIIDYSKFKYEQKKKQKEIKQKSQKTVVKEIRFGPNTDDHDLNFKLKHAEKFIEEGNKLKTYVQFRGRNIVYKDRGRDLLDRIADHLEEKAKIEMEPKMEGRRMIMIMAPR